MSSRATGPRGQHAGDYFVVSGENGTWYVSTAMARHIEAQLDAETPTGWVRFVDLSGSRVRLSIRQIEFLCQSTEEQRARDRAFTRTLTRERKADSSWGDDQ